MKKIFCNINLFDLHQQVYLIDTDANKEDCIGLTELDKIPEMICSLCDNKKVYKVILSGNKEYNNKLSNNILEYSKMNYNNNNIEIEVI